MARGDYAVRQERITALSGRNVEVGHESAKHQSTRQTRRMELVVPALRDPIYRGDLAAALQQSRPLLDGYSVLLLVSALVGDHRRYPHGDRLFRDRGLRGPSETKNLRLAG